LPSVTLYQAEFGGKRNVSGVSLFELGRSESGHVFELIGQMLNTAVVHAVRDLAQGTFLIFQQFFHPFDLLFDDELFDGGTFSTDENRVLSE
jgi:hypothetical protein